MDELKKLASTAPTREAAENLIISTYHGLPDELLDPTKQDEVYSHAKSELGKTKLESATAGIIDAHLSNFEQAYANRLPNAKAIGFQRNVEGQGLPGTQQWVKSEIHKSGENKG